MQLRVKDCVSLSVYTVTFLLGLPSNLLVLFVYVRKAAKRGATPGVVYALNLVLANLVLVAWLPVKALETLLRDWTLPAPLCPVYSFFLFASLYGSCLFITAVTVGRYLSVAFPVVYRRHRRARHSCLVCAALWALVLLHLGVGLMAEGGASFVGVQGEASTCFGHFNASQLRVLLPLRLEMAAVLFLLPLALTAVCTLRCAALLRRSNLRPAAKRRVLAVALTTLAALVAGHAPYNASHVVGFVQRADVAWRGVAMLTSTCNVFLEPAVLLLLAPAGSRGVLRRLCGQRAEGRSHPGKPPTALTIIKAPPTLSGRSQASGAVTKPSRS